MEPLPPQPAPGAAGSLWTALRLLWRGGRILLLALPALIAAPLLPLSGDGWAAKMWWRYWLWAVARAGPLWARGGAGQGAG